MFTWNRFRSGLAVAVAVLCATASAQNPEYRAAWADAFNTGYLSPSALTTTAGNLRTANLNVFVPEIYVSSLIYWNPTASEYPDLGSAATIVSNGVPITCDLNSDPEHNSAGSFDPLGSAISECHDTSAGKARLDVWAWMVSFSPSGALQSAHPDWITVNTDGSWQTDLDPGHPGAAQELYYKCMDIVKHYDVDGLNFDFVRFTNVNNGFNPVSIQRYNAIKGKSGTPLTSDASFKQWRRDQVTNIIRKIYLNVIAIKPNVKISVDAITWTPSPARPVAGDKNPLQTWRYNFQANTGAYTSVYQDWRGWMEEGMIDIAMPMNYFRECANKADYDKWSDFAKDNQFGRQCVIGPGGYLNSLNDALAQLARTRDASSTMGMFAAGQNNYSYAAPYASACNGTIQWGSSALRDALAAGMYALPAPIPQLPRLLNGKGHIKGTVVSSLVASPGWVDGATVYLSSNADGSGPIRTMPTDGTGFYGFIDVAPGNYFVRVHAKNHGDQIKAVAVTAAEVSTVDFTLAEPPPASQLAFSVQPGNAAAGFAFTSQPVVVGKDTTGIVVAAFHGPVTLAIKPGTGAEGASLLGPLSVNAVNGVATFSGVSIDRPGTGYVLTATSGNLTSAESNAFPVAPPPTQLAFTIQPGGVPINVALDPQPVVVAKDVNGDIATAFPGTITLAILPGTGAAGALISGTTALTPVDGAAAFKGLSINQSGTGYVLVASSSGLTSANSAPFNIASVPTKLAVLTQPSASKARLALPTQPVFAVQDAAGNTVSGFNGPVSVSIMAATGVPGATLGGTTTVNAASGIAAFTDLSIDKVGFAYRLTASSGSLTPVDTVAFDIGTTAVKLAFETQPGGAKAGKVFSIQPVVVAQNASGGLATDYIGNADVAIKDGTGASLGYLDGSGSLSFADGRASFTDLAISDAGAGYVLTAGSGTMSPVDSAPFDVAVGGPYTLAEAARAVSLVAGLGVSNSMDSARLDLGLPPGLDLLDATRMLRKITGLEPNP